MTDNNDLTISKLQCHKCGEDLEQQGISSFGKCPECGRKMLFSEWRKLLEGESSSSSEDDIVRAHDESSNRKGGGEPPILIMLECPDCGGRRSVEPDNSLYQTGGYECPDCSVRFKPVAKYEKEGGSSEG